jgi:hypothetical protein
MPLDTHWVWVQYLRRYEIVLGDDLKVPIYAYFPPEPVKYIQ